MREELVVGSAEQLRALAHPLRLQVLNALADRPMTNKQLSQTLGEPPARVHFHVRALHDAGFIDLVEERPKGGVIEKYYRAAARHIRVSPLLGDRALGHEGLTDATLKAAGKELARAIAYFHGPPPGVHLAHERAFLSKEALASVESHIRAIEEELKSARVASEGNLSTRPVAITYLLHPLPPREEEEASPNL